MQTSQLRRANAIFQALLASTLFALSATARASDDISVSILYHEPVRLIETFESSQDLVPGATIASLVFDAFSRRFELLPDDRRTIRRNGRTGLHGRLAGLDESWFSLMRDGAELSGMISDGTDLYLIEPRHRVAELLIEPPADDAPANLIYRLADTLVPAGLLACDTHDDPMPAGAYIDGQSAAGKLSAELQAVTSIAAATATLPLRVGVVADETFVEQHGNNSETEIDAIFITTQGILLQELGLELEVADVLTITPGVSSPFSDTVITKELLYELGNWRRNNQADLGHTHLLTRKRLVNDDGDNLAGISYVGEPGGKGACDRLTGASISRDIRGLTALIVTHEIGHNLGAPHDGDPAGACASESPTDFIMSASVSRYTSERFSACSIAEIEKFIAAAWCLNEDVETLPASSNGGGGGSLGWLSLTGLLCSPLLRRRRHVLPDRPSGTVIS